MVFPKKTSKQVQLYLLALLTESVVCPQASAYASEEGVLTEVMIDERVDNALIAHRKKVAWQQEEIPSGLGVMKAKGSSYKSSKDLSTYTPPPSSTS